MRRKDRISGAVEMSLQRRPVESIIDDLADVEVDHPRGEVEDLALSRARSDPTIQHIASTINDLDRTLDRLQDTDRETVESARKSRNLQQDVLRRKVGEVVDQTVAELASEWVEDAAIDRPDDLGILTGERA